MYSSAMGEESALQVHLFYNWSSRMLLGFGGVYIISKVWVMVSGADIHYPPLIVWKLCECGALLSDRMRACDPCCVVV